MKLWKCAAIAFTLCGATLSFLFTRVMISNKRGHLISWASSSPQSSSAATLSSALEGNRHRTRRAAQDFSSVFQEFSQLFQSFTEGELEQIVGSLIERKAQRDLESLQGKRTKREKKKKRRSCSLRHVVVSVSDLGLGYDSDETLLFKYCSGGCGAHRRNYDLTLEHMKTSGILKAERSSRAGHKPCCRPTAYEDDVSFLDNRNRYHTIHNVSAQECGCV